jgi:hypothetical protein
MMGKTVALFDGSDHFGGAPIRIIVSRSAGPIWLPQSFAISLSQRDEMLHPSIRYGD